MEHILPQVRVKYISQSIQNEIPKARINIKLNLHTVGD
ncbi:hypothetical protein yberc0001_33970 [Yersinia bercovieri ATCC 43970]|uniref:Uncharacterized protein n=1 Tax=Yersinia bercovieri ATCC 43970 TaxID=349968 RepID=A0ABM9XYJ9_YERBE|nr:hypothetical protein yberc0001_33970 [Yersinia bercovieri ATCC 43970]